MVKIKGIVLFVSFLMLNQLPAQNSWSTKLDNYNKSGDTTIYYKFDDFSKSDVSFELLSIDQINKEVSKFNYFLYRYSNTQYILLPSGFIEESVENIAASAKVNQRMKELEAGNIVNSFVVNNGSKNEKSKKLNLRISDPDNNQNLIGASVLNINNQLNYSTNENGICVIETNDSDLNLNISYPGYNARKIEVLLFSSGNLDIPLSQQEVYLEGVTVTDNAASKVRGTVGLEQLSVKQIKKIPSLMGQIDVIKSLTILAGVSSNSDGVGGINVRGGNADQNLILLDDVIHYNPNHALGFISSFNADFISNVNLYKGYIPPKYGGRIASVFATETRIPNTKKWVKKLGLGISNSSISAEGPIIKDKTSIAVSARASHANWMISLINLPDANKSKINFLDYQTRLEHKLTKSTTIGGSFYNSKDNFLLLGESNFVYQTKSFQGYVRQIIGNHTNLSLKYTSSSYNSELADAIAQNPLFLLSGIDNQDLKFIGTSTIKDYEISYGFENNEIQILPGLFNTSRETKNLNTEKANEKSYFLEVKKEFTDQLSINAGARFVNYKSKGDRKIFTYNEGFKTLENIADTIVFKSNQVNSRYNFIEPRLSINYNLNDYNSIKLGLNRNNQFTSVLSNTIAPTPVDFWKSSDYHFKPLSSTQYFISYNKSTFKSRWEGSFEIYYTEIDNVQDYKDFANLYNNPHLETDIIFGRGKNYGLELSVSKNTGKLQGKMAYTLSRSLKQINREGQEVINNGAWYPTLVDKPHDFNLLLTYNPTQRWSFNLAFNYNTGQPTTVPFTRFSDWNATSVLFFSDRNTYRVPDYHRLDLSINLLPSYKLNRKVKSTWNFSVLNLYGRKNAYSIFFRQPPFENVITFKYAVLGTVLPSITLNLEF